MRPPPPSLLELAADRFTGALGKVASDVATACTAEIPSYGDLEATGVVQEVEVAFREHAHVLTRAIVDRRLLSREELAGLCGLGRRRFAQGLPLHDLVAGYQVGTRVALDHFLAHLKATPCDPAEHALTANEVTRHTLQIAAQATGAISRAYLAAQDEAGGLPPAPGLDLGWLASNHDSDRLTVCLKHLGFTAAASNIVCLIAVKEPQDGDIDPFRPLASQLEVALRLNTRGLLFGRADRRLVVVIGIPLDGRGTSHWLMEALASLSSPDGPFFTTAIGEIGESVEGIQRSYRQALQVMELLENASDIGPVMTYAEALPYLLLVRSPDESHALIDSVLAPLLGDPNADRLVETLDVYFGSGTSTKAAERLRIHRQSLYERLWRIQDLTSLSFEDSGDRLRFQLALKALKTLGRNGQ